VGARNAVESLLVSIWEEVLGRSGIGIHDNFFDLGGNSLKLIQVVQRMSIQHNLKISVTDVFKYPNINELYKFLQNSDTTKDDKAAFLNTNILDNTLRILNTKED